MCQQIKSGLWLERFVCVLHLSKCPDLLNKVLHALACERILDRETLQKTEGARLRPTSVRAPRNASTTQLDAGLHIWLETNGIIKACVSNSIIDAAVLTLPKDLAPSLFVICAICTVPHLQYGIYYQDTFSDRWLSYESHCILRLDFLQNEQ